MKEAPVPLPGTWNKAGYPMAAIYSNTAEVGMNNHQDIIYTCSVCLEMRLSTLMCAFIYRTSSKNLAFLIIRHPLPYD